MCSLLLGKTVFSSHNSRSEESINHPPRDRHEYGAPIFFSSKETADDATHAHDMFVQN